MAKRIIWSLQAQNDRKDILRYWKDKNKSNTYSIKLNRLFVEAVKLIAQHPKIGKPTDITGVRAKLVRDYYILFKDEKEWISILSIWDTRQNPAKLKEKLKV